MDHMIAPIRILIEDALPPSANRAFQAPTAAAARIIGVNDKGTDRTIAGRRGEATANPMMKALAKATRRVTPRWALILAAAAGLAGTDAHAQTSPVLTVAVADPSLYAGAAAGAAAWTAMGVPVAMVDGPADVLVVSEFWGPGGAAAAYTEGGAIAVDTYDAATDWTATSGYGCHEIGHVLQYLYGSFVDPIYDASWHRFAGASCMTDAPVSNPYPDALDVAALGFVPVVPVAPAEAANGDGSAMVDPPTVAEESRWSTVWLRLGRGSR